MPATNNSTAVHHRQYSTDDISLPHNQSHQDIPDHTIGPDSTDGYRPHDIYTNNQLIDVELDTSHLQPSGTTKFIQASPLITSQYHNNNSESYNTIDQQQYTPVHGKQPCPPVYHRTSGTLFTTFQNLVKPFIGAGILALPHAFRQGGVISSSILMLVLAITVNYCIKKLIICADMIEIKNMARSLSSHNNTTPYSQPTNKYHRFHDISDTKQNNDNNDMNNDDMTYIDPQDDLIHTTDDDYNDTTTSIHTNNKLHINTNITHISVQQPNRTPNTVSTPISAPTYRQIGYHSFGHAGSILVDLCLCTSQLGFCIAYVSFISENMSSLTYNILSRRIWCLILIPIFTGLCQIRSMKTLAPTSIFGNITYAVSIAIIFYDGFSHTSQWVTHDTVNYVSISGIPYFFGTACFALEGAGLVLPVRNTMSNKSQFNTLLSAGLTTVTICYIVFSVLCYIFFGPYTNSVITQNLESGALTVSVKLCLSLSLLFSYAIQLYPVTQMFDQLFDKFIWKYNPTTKQSTIQQQYEPLSTPCNHNDQSMDNHHTTTSNTQSTIYAGLQYKRRVTQITLRCVIVLLTVILAMVFPDFGIIVSLIGCLSNSGIAFILPMLFYCKLVIYDNERTRIVDVIQAWIVPVCIVCIGIAASVSGLVVTIQSIV